jgi:hypothetical protein
VAQLTLPDSHRDAIVSLLQLPADDSNHLIKQLQACEGRNAAMIDVLDEAVGNGNGRSVLRAIVMFAVLPQRFGLSAEEVEEAAKSSFGVPDSAFPLGELIALRPIQKFAKALDLRNTYERILLKSRIVSDVRPVFDDEEIGDVDAAMVNHSLQLKLRVGDDESDLHIAVDVDDLTSLQKQIERALEKESAARRFIEKGEATVLEALE